jgi:hypothetical protein
VNKLLKSITVVFVFAAWMTLPSCAPKPNSDMSLQQEASDLQQRTLPPDSRLVSQHPLTRQGRGASASWEFDSNYAPDAYNRWVTSRLRPDFEVRETTNSHFRFSKYTHGDEETVSVETASSSGTPHVAVKLEAYPD